MTVSVAPQRGGMQSGNNVIPKGYGAGKLEQFTPEQQQLFQQMFSQVGPDSFLSRLSQGDESLFSQLEQPAMRQFSQLQGNTAARFSRGGGQGSLGAYKSSGFRNELGQQGSDFAQQLQGNRLQMRQQALMELLGLSQNLLGQRPYENFLYEKPEKDNTSFLSKLMAGALPLAGAGIGGFAGSYASMPLEGAAIGAQAGAAASRGFFGGSK